MTRPPASDSPPATGDRDAPLRDDVRRLGSLLGELLREIAPPGVYHRVEEARLAARRRRAGDADADRELSERLAGLPPPAALEVVRAFSAYFDVVNTAEQVHRMRRRIDYRRAGTPQPGSFRAAVAALHLRGVTIEEIGHALDTITLEPVFTAHPTEAVRRTLLAKHQRLAQALVERLNADVLDPADLARIDSTIALEMASAWQTEEQLPGRPSVDDEVEHMLFFLSDVLYRVVPALHAELGDAIAEVYGTPLDPPRAVVRFASWVGGDMDGNPNVGADTIGATLDRHARTAMRCYRQDLMTLHEHLSQSESRTEIDSAVRVRIEHYGDLMPAAEDEITPRFAGMHYRRLLWLCMARLEAAGSGADGGYRGPEEFGEDLRLIAASLERHDGARAGLALVRRTLRRLDVFGFHLASLDVRQHAEVHRRAAAVVLGDSDFSERSVDERTAALAKALGKQLAPPATPDEETARSLAAFRALAKARRRHGEGSVGLYIVSMANGPDDALAVLLLAQAAGLVDESGAVPLDVAPLFETVDDLERGPSTLDALIKNDAYRAHLAQRGDRQIVMLGYSDSSKDAGIAASRLGLERAQTELAAVAAGSGISLTLFHGRGGSLSRGGSKPRAAILSAPRGTLADTVRVTEQGEVLDQKYGLRGIATRSLELGVGALLERSAGEDPAPEPTPTQLEIAATCARASRHAYAALVHDEPRFPDLFAAITPIDVIERMEIGSRPPRRGQMRSVADLRAIPWVFAWTQCRVILPGWFGVGQGLRAAIEAHGHDAVRDAVAHWPYFATLVSDVEMVLAKSDLDIASRYAELAGDVGAELFPRIVEEHAATVTAILELTGQSALLEREPTLKRSIRLRNPYVDPMSVVQVDALARWRAADRNDPDLERLLVQTVRGIARGLRNTG